MIDKLKFLYTEQYKTNIAFTFLLSFIVFQPILKYFEYVLLFPRINYSIFIIIMLDIITLSVFLCIILICIFSIIAYGWAAVSTILFIITFLCKN